MTEEELKNIPFQFVGHMSMIDMHTTTYSSKDGKLGFCDYVPFKNDEPCGRSYRHYRIGTKWYKSKKRLLEALKNFKID